MFDAQKFRLKMKLVKLMNMVSMVKIVKMVKMAEMWNWNITASPLQRLPWEDLRGLDRVFTTAVISEKQKEHLSKLMQEIFMVILHVIL